jgi:NAD(P)-dependent dehydrogenase (short-subunit alcohol dehydrogenase family)
LENGMNGNAGMSQALRFDGRVAVITGAGRSPGLGRSYSRYLAARGARVVVNDRRRDVGADGLSGAERVVREIVADGGEAIVDHHSVSQPDSARAVVDAALTAWGRLDILINNAGVIIPAPFDALTEPDVVTTIEVHLMGHIWMSRAAWPSMVAQGYGRILNTSSGVMLGLGQQVVYGAAKGGIFSLTRGLAVEGHRHGILVNSISPSAGMAGARDLSEPGDRWMEDVFMADYSPDLVAPVAAYLVHDSCQQTAQWISSAGGRTAAGFFSRTPGIDDVSASVEGIAARLPEVLGRVGSAETPHPIDASRASSFKPRPYVPRT